MSNDYHSLKSFERTIPSKHAKRHFYQGTTGTSTYRCFSSLQVLLDGFEDVACSSWENECSRRSSSTLSTSKRVYMVLLSPDIDSNILHIVSKSHIHLNIIGISHFFSKKSSILVMIADMGKSGHVNRREPEGPKLMDAYENVKHVFDQVYWYLYCAKMDGYHYDVA